MPEYLKRLSGFLIGIAIDAIVAYELITRPDKSPVTIIGDIISLDAVLVGVAVIAAGAAIACAWPVIVWLWTIPKRWVERKQAEVERQLAELERRESTERKNVVNLLVTVRDQDQLIWAAENHRGRLVETEETVAIAREKLQAMGLDLPEVIRGSGPNWIQHAGRLIPHVEAGGLRQAQSKVAEWYPDSWEAGHSESDP